MTNDIEWHWQPLYCQASNIKLKIFEKLHFDVFKKKSSTKPQQGVIVWQPQGSQCIILRLSFVEGKKKKKHMQKGESPLEAASTSCDHT